MKAYREGYRFIINSGGSRSSKTYSTLQLLYLLAKNSQEPYIIHVVSVSLPHLRDGAITDFDQIIQAEGENLDKVKIKSPYTYTIGKSTIRFIGADKIGSVLGSQRDILFINEANNMKWAVVHQLIQRTTQTIFIDYNPSVEFWVDTEGVSKRDNAVVLNSTFMDNIDNLSTSQITEFKEGKIKHDLEVSKGIQGHWFNWWRVYGLGLEGILSGAIFNNWSTGDFDTSLPFGYCIDFGTKDPFTCTKVAINGKTKQIYLQQIIYKTGLTPNTSVQAMEGNKISKDAYIVVDCADKGWGNTLVEAGFNIVPAKKGAGSVVSGINALQDYEMIVTEESEAIIKELRGYIWLDKRGEVPVDDYNHVIDPVRYYEKFYNFIN